MIFIVGVLHGRVASGRQLESLIERIQPDFVMVELCRERVDVVEQDPGEEYLPSEFKTAKMAADLVPNCRVILGDRADSVTGRVRN